MARAGGTPRAGACRLVVLLFVCSLSPGVGASEPPSVERTRASLRRLPPVSKAAGPVVTASGLVDLEATGASAPIAPAPIIPALIAAERGAPSLEERVAQLEKQLQESEEDRRQSAERESSRPTGRLTMQIQADAYESQQDSANLLTVGEIPDGSAFRRARFGFTGEYLVTEYRVEMDFALSGRPSFLDNWVAINEVPYLGQVKIGHYFEPFSLERVTPNRFVTFLERPLPDQPFAPARNLGIMAQNHSEDLRRTWAIGVFRSNSDVFGDDTGDRREKALTGRLTWLPWYDEMADGRHYAHLGAAYSLRAADNDTVQFSAQPEARLGAASPNFPFFVDTGAIVASSFQLYGLEAAWVNGPWSLQGEYFYVPVDRRDAPDPAFHGAYLTATYFLTGEHRPYRREIGVFDRVIPFEDFFLVRTASATASGLGAWEVAARLSHLDLQDQGITGGRLTDLTLGLNWYWNPYARMSLNYVHPMLSDRGFGRSEADILGARASFDF